MGRMSSRMMLADAQRRCHEPLIRGCDATGLDKFSASLTAMTVWVVTGRVNLSRGFCHFQCAKHLAKSGAIRCLRV